MTNFKTCYNFILPFQTPFIKLGWVYVIGRLGR